MKPIPAQRTLCLSRMNPLTSHFITTLRKHFEEPMACHREIARVLKPGGLLLFQTPSRYCYPMLAAQVTPQWFHEFYVRHFGLRPN